MNNVPTLLYHLRNASGVVYTVQVTGDKQKNNSWNNKAHERDAMEQMGKALPHVLIRSLRGRPCRRCDAHAKKTPPTRAVQPSISWRSWSSETLLVTHFRSMSCRWVFPPAPRLRSRVWLRVGLNGAYEEKFVKSGSWSRTDPSINITLHQTFISQILTTPLLNNKKPPQS